MAVALDHMGQTQSSGSKCGPQELCNSYMWLFESSRYADVALCENEFDIFALDKRPHIVVNLDM